MNVGDRIAELEAQRDAQFARNRELACRIRQWYETGRKGLATLAAKRNMTPTMIADIEYWFKKGDVNLKPIIKELENKP